MIEQLFEKTRNCLASLMYWSIMQPSTQKWMTKLPKYLECHLSVVPSTCGYGVLMFTWQDYWDLLYRPLF